MLFKFMVRQYDFDSRCVAFIILSGRKLQVKIERGLLYRYYVVNNNRNSHRDTILNLADTITLDLYNKVYFIILLL